MRSPNNGFVYAVNYNEVLMFEALLTLPDVKLLPITDAIDVYGWYLPPAAAFVVTDSDNPTTRTEEEPDAN